MGFWFLRGMRRGVVTTRYPTELDGWAAELPTPPAFRPALLTHPLADRMIAICPTGALTRDDSHLVIDLGACSGCRRCLESRRGRVAERYVGACRARPRGVDQAGGD